MIYGPFWHLGEQYPLTAASDTKDSNSAKRMGLKSKHLHEEDVAAAEMNAAADWTNQRS